MGPYKDDDSKVTGNQSNVINEEMGLEGQGRRDVWRFDSLQHLVIFVQRECYSLYGMNVIKILIFHNQCLFSYLVSVPTEGKEVLPLVCLCLILAYYTRPD